MCKGKWAGGKELNWEATTERKLWAVRRVEYKGMLEADKGKVLLEGRQLYTEGSPRLQFWANQIKV